MSNSAAASSVRLPLWRDTVTATSSGICTFCHDPQLVGERMGFIVFGPGHADWERAHERCAEQEVLAGRLINGVRPRPEPGPVRFRPEGASLNFERPKSGLEVWWRELEPPEIVNPRERYVVLEGAVEILRLTVKDEAIGAAKGIDAYRRKN